jgi:hypothetical protein
VWLIDGEHALCAKFRRPDRGSDLLSIVGEIVDYFDAARLANDLEASPDTREIRERAHHIFERRAEHVTGGDCGKRICNIVRAGNRQLKLRVTHAEAAGAGSELDFLAANIGARAEAETKRPTGELIEIFGVAYRQRLTRTG